MFSFLTSMIDTLQAKSMYKNKNVYLIWAHLKQKWTHAFLITSAEHSQQIDTSAVITPWKTKPMVQKKNNKNGLNNYPFW